MIIPLVNKPLSAEELVVTRRTRGAPANMGAIGCGPEKAEISFGLVWFSKISCGCGGNGEARVQPKKAEGIADAESKHNIKDNKGEFLDFSFLRDMLLLKGGG